MENVQRLRQQLLHLQAAGRVKLSPTVQTASIEDLIKHGLNNLGIFHVQKVLFTTKEGDFSSENLNLLFYYHNRLNGYQLGSLISAN